MHCMTCPREFPTYFATCPHCTKANPLYLVSLKVVADPSTNGIGTSTPSIEVLPVNGVPEELVGRNGIWKMALELHHSGQRQYVIITANNNERLDAVLWNVSPALIRPIQRGPAALHAHMIIGFLIHLSHLLYQPLIHAGATILLKAVMEAKSLRS